MKILWDLFVLRLKELTIFNLQRLFRKGHYSNEDLWNLSTSLARIILPKIVAYKNMDRSGYPSFVKNAIEWEAILDEIIFSLRYVLYDDCAMNDKEMEEFEQDYNYNEGDPDQWALFQERCAIGLEKFGEVFRSLWD